MLFHRLISPDAVLMLFVICACLLGYGYPAYRARSGPDGTGFAWFVWLVCGILALIQWVILVFI